MCRWPQPFPVAPGPASWRHRVGASRECGVPRSVVVALRESETRLRPRTAWVDRGLFAAFRPGAATQRRLARTGFAFFCATFFLSAFAAGFAFFATVLLGAFFFFGAGSAAETDPSLPLIRS